MKEKLALAINGREGDLVLVRPLAAQLHDLDVFVDVPTPPGHVRIAVHGVRVSRGVVFQADKLVESSRTIVVRGILIEIERLYRIIGGKTEPPLYELNGTIYPSFNISQRNSSRRI